MLAKAATQEWLHHHAALLLSMSARVRKDGRMEKRGKDMGTDRGELLVLAVLLDFALIVLGELMDILLIFALITA